MDKAPDLNNDREPYSCGAKIDRNKPNVHTMGVNGQL
jgi:hypothetical protein